MKPEKDKEGSKTTPASKKPAGSKVFDVSRPGKTPASPTSKPVISGHKPEAQAAQASVSGIGEARTLLNRRKIEITPLGYTKAEKVETSPEDKPSGESAQPTQQETEGLGTAALDSVTGPPELHQEKSPVRISTSPKLKIEPLPGPDKPAEDKPELAQPATEAETEESKPEAETPAEIEVAEAEPAAKTEPELSDKELPAETSSMPVAEPLVAKPEDGKEEPAPEPVIEPLFDDSGSIVVSNHEHHHGNHGLKVFGLLLLILLLATAAFDVLLDLGFLTIESLPHTNLL